MRGEVQHIQPARKLWRLVQLVGAGALMVGLALFFEGDFKNPWPVFVGVGFILLLLGSVLAWRHRG